MTISKSDLELLEKALPFMSEDERRDKLKLLTEYKKELTKEKGALHFLDFIKHVYPNYIIGEHHKKLAQLFEDIANGKKKRIIVNIAPRH